MYVRKNVVSSAFATVAVIGALMQAPTATADDDLVDVGIAGGSCSVGSFGLTQLVKKVRYGGLLSAALAGAGAPICTVLFKKWLAGQPGPLVVQTPSGHTFTQTLRLRDLDTDIPDWQPWNTREVQCSGYIFPVYRDACIRGEIDPVHR
jgi:hypothetical protein